MEAGEASGYRLDGLRAALASGVAPGTATTPRLPKATGLPKGPLDAGGTAPMSAAPPDQAPGASVESDDVAPADWMADAGDVLDEAPPADR
jgi:hypothetical protein